MYGLYHVYKFDFDANFFDCGDFHVDIYFPDIIISVPVTSTLNHSCMCLCLCLTIHPLSLLILDL